MSAVSIPFPAPDPGPLSVADVIRLYERHCAAEHVHCEAARTDRERTFRLFVTRFGSLPVAEAKPYHLTDFIEEQSTWKSVSTRRSKANEIRAAFEWAAKNERIPRNPFASVRYAEAERRPELPDHVLADLAEASNPRAEVALLFLRLTWCRVSELCEAIWADMDVNQGLWTVSRHKSRRYTGKPKIIPLVPDAIELLRSLSCAELDATEHVFLNNRNRPWTRRTLGQHVRRIKARHGIMAAGTIHGIRHASASEAVRNGAPLKFVSLMLGHASTQITEKYYVHVDGQIDAIKAAAEKSLRKEG